MVPAQKGFSRRRLLQMLGVGTTGMLLASCAPGTAPSPAPAVAPTVITPGVRRPEEIGDYVAHTNVSGTINFPNCWGGARIPPMEEQIANFSKFYPDVTINSSVAECGDMDKQHLTSIAAGTPPDVIMLRADSIPFYVQQNALTPLDDLAERDEINVDQHFYKSEIDTHRWNGQLWGLPNVVAGTRHMLWWNKDLFEKAGLDPETPPKTWQDLNEMAEVVRANAPGHYLLEHNHTSGGHPPFLVWMTTNGGKYVSDDLKEIAFNSPEGLETLEWMLDFTKRQANNYEEMAAIEAPRQNSMEGSTWANQVYLTATAGPWYFLQLKNAAPDMSYGVTLLPYNGENPNGSHATPAYAGWSYCIPNGAQNPEAGWEWIKYACAGRGQYSFMKAQDRPTTVRAYNDDPDLHGNNPFWDVVIADLEANVPIPVMPTFPSIRDTMYDMAEAVLFEKQTPAEALEAGAARSQQFLDEWLATLG